MKYQQSIILLVLLLFAISFVLTLDDKKKSTKKKTSSKGSKTTTTETLEEDDEEELEEENEENASELEQLAPLPLLDVDLENASLFNLPKIYMRLVLYVLPNLVFRMLVGRLVPFLLCTGIFVGFKCTNDDSFSEEWPWSFATMYLGMEVTAFFRFWSGEFYSEITRRFFPSMTYKNGSITFENTLFEIDLISFLYSSLIYALANEPDNGITGTVFLVSGVISISSGLLLSGLPGIRHWLWIGYLAAAIYCGYRSFIMKAYLFSVCIIPLLLFLVASSVNDGASHFQYPPSLSAPYKK